MSTTGPAGPDYDHSTSGKDIQAAMVAAAKARSLGKKGRGSAPAPLVIRWGSLRICTADALPVPQMGRLRLEFLANKRQVRQGADLAMEGGCQLADGTRVPLLRTWDDEGYEPSVEYDYLARDGRITGRR